MAEPSFQDVFKLMNSIVSFEELLDATSLKPETCITLGIHEKFKQLYEKLSKYVQHEETKDLPFRSVCNVCWNEVKILNYDIRTSVAIHNAGELHRVAVKTMEVDKQDRDFEGKSVQKSIGSKTIPSDDNVLKPAGELASTITANNADTKIDSKELWNVDLETKSIPYVIDLKSIPKELFKPTGKLPSRPTTTAENVDMDVVSQDWNLNLKIPVAQLIDFNNFPGESIKPSGKVTNNIVEPLNVETESASRMMDLNNIPNELLKSTSNATSISQNKEFVSNNLNANISSPCTTCQQVFCICGYKDKNMQVLNEKMLNVNVSQQGVMYSLPATTSTIRVKNPLPQSCTNKKPQEKRSAKPSAIASGTQPKHVPPQTTATGGKNPPRPSRTNKKPKEKESASKPAVVESNPQQQYLNVHVHMPFSGGESAKPFTQPVAVPRLQERTKKNTFEENLELLSSKTLGQQEEMQLFYKMLRQAEAKYWHRSHFTKTFNKEQHRNEYVCNVCNTGSRIINSLHVVQHARGKSHQNALRSSLQCTENVDREKKDKEEPCGVM